MNPRLQRIQALIRQLNLLPAVEQIRYQIARIRYMRENARFRNQYPGFALPPAYLAFDAHGQVRWRKYLESGQAVASQLVGVIKSNSVNRPPPLRILEWGCGPGRVIRHLPSLLPDSEIYGSDYNDESVEWCKTAIPNVKFTHNQLRPPLPFEDNLFDVVYAISVITHLSEQGNIDWITELSRILKPDGILVLWSNGDSIADFLLPGERERYDAEDFTERTRYQEGKKMYMALHPPAWIRGKLLKNYRILNHYPGGFSGKEQDVWVAQLRTK